MDNPRKYTFLNYKDNVLFCTIIMLKEKGRDEKNII